MSPVDFKKWPCCPVKFKGRGPQVKGQGPQVKGQGPQVKGQGPQVKGRGPLDSTITRPPHVAHVGHEGTVADPGFKKKKVGGGGTLMWFTLTKVKYGSKREGPPLISH